MLFFTGNIYLYVAVYISQLSNYWDKTQPPPFKGEMVYLVHVSEVSVHGGLDLSRNIMVADYVGVKVLSSWGPGSREENQHQRGTDETSDTVLI